MTIYDERLNETLPFFEDLNDDFKVELDAGPEGCLKRQMERGLNGTHLHCYRRNGRVKYESVKLLVNA